MFTNEKNVQIVIKLLKEHGIKNIVINPGATNLPIVRAVQKDSFFEKYSVVDERSAAYFAIGLSLEKNEPVAISCTSAQATRNYIPGLTEAYYKKIPILALTSSKHPKHTYQEYMQAPDQTSLPVDSVKKSFALPVVDSKEDFDMCSRMVNDALLALTHHGCGPIQLNVPIVNASTFETKELPDVKVIRRYSEISAEDNDYVKNKKILVVIGEHARYTEAQIESIDKFCETHDAVVYANHIANYHGKYSINANLLLTCMSPAAFVKEKLNPDLLITIGGQTGDYPLYEILSDARSGDYECWRVSDDGAVVDVFDRLTHVYEMPFADFFEFLSQRASCKKHTYFDTFMRENNNLNIPNNLPFSNTYVAQQLHDKLPKNARLNFGILNSLRVWSFFDLDPTITCESNVAAFGIDGGLSVTVGQSVVTSELCFCVLGDLSFFYDMNSLGIRHIKSNLRILLVNNSMGAEFRMYNHAANQFGEEANDFSAAAGHNGSSARGWAEANNFKYLSARNKEEFQMTYDEFLSESSKEPILFEIFTNEKDESDALKRMNTESYEGGIIRDKLARSLSSTQKAKIKNILHRIKK